MMMINWASLKAVLISVTLLFSLTGCVWIEGTQDLVKYVAEVQARPSRPIKSLPEFEAYEAFVYEGTSLRNPFLAVVKFVSEDDDDGETLQVDPGNTPEPNEERIKDYLESYAIKNLSMVGTISKGVGEDWALIVDPNGEIHRVAAGAYMGRDHGSVIKVTANKIKLIETISNGRGGWITRPRNIELIETKGP
jgi:type IV pilus assembly protein PilP